MKYKHDWNSMSTPPIIYSNGGYVAVLGRYYNGEEVYLEYEPIYDSIGFAFFTADGDDVTKHLKGWKYF
jgi:hypothetical protein